MHEFEHVSIDPPSEEYDIPDWTITGDLRAPGSGWDDDANYDCRDSLEKLFPNIEFDPESSQFFAYAKSEGESEGLAQAIDTWVKTRRNG